MPRLSLAIVVLLAACSAPAAQPTTAPPSPTASAARAEVVKYKLGVLDLCAKTDLAPLADLGLTKTKSTDRRPPFIGTGESCLIEFDREFPATVQVQAWAPTTLEEATNIYAAQRGKRMTPDGPVSGVGDIAEGFTIETEPRPGFKYSEYRIQARDSNLIVDVWLAVGNSAFTPKQTLAAKALIMLKAALATVSQAWKA